MTEESTDQTDRPDPFTDPVPVHVAVSRVMADVGAIGKDRRADPKMGGYAFRGIDDLYNALHGPLSRHGVFYTPEILGREERDYRTSGGATMRLVQLEMRYTFHGPAGDRLEVGPVVGEAADTADKAANKAMTAALKYLLFQVFCIPVDGETADADADAGTPDLGERVDPAYEEARAELEVALREAREAGLEIDADTARNYARQSTAHAQQAVSKLRERIADHATSPELEDPETGEPLPHPDGTCDTPACSVCGGPLPGGGDSEPDEPDDGPAGESTSGSDDQDEGPDAESDDGPPDPAVDLAGWHDAVNATDVALEVRRLGELATGDDDPEAWAQLERIARLEIAGDDRKTVTSALDRVGVKIDLIRQRLAESSGEPSDPPGEGDGTPEARTDGPEADGGHATGDDEAEERRKLAARYRRAYRTVHGADEQQARELHARRIELVGADDRGFLHTEEAAALELVELAESMAGEVDG